jgi:probable HAF family extracellular repeat protein
MKNCLLLAILVGVLRLLAGCGGGSSTTQQTQVLATHFSVTPANSSPIAGTVFSFSVTALDASNAVVGTYAGTVQFTSSDGHAVLPVSSKLTNGAATFSATLKTAGPQTITVTDAATPSIAGTSRLINVGAAGTPHLSVMASATAVSGTAFNFTVTALDASNNVATNYPGAVHFTSTDGQATLPANSTLTNGTANFSATLKTSGKQTITAADTVTASITGTSSSINVSAPGSLAITSGAPPNGTVGAAYSGTVQRCRGGQCVELGGFPLTASGGASPYAWKWVAASGSSLPIGLSVSFDGFVRGEPKAAGVYNVTVIVTDSASPAVQASANYSINIAAAAALAISSGSPPGGHVGEAYDVHCNQIPPCNLMITGFPLNSTGGAYPYSWSWSGSTPPGLTIGSFHCANLQVGICGTPTTAGTYNFTVTLTDSESPAVHVSANYTMDVISGAATANTADLADPQHRRHHHYKFVELETFGGPQSFISGEPSYSVINNSGTVVGGADTSILTPEPACYNPIQNPDCFISHAFERREGSLKDLGTLPGGNFSFAAEINQRGQIAGVSETNLTDPATGNPEFHAVLWENDKILDLGTLGGTASFAVMLNDRGQVIGEALNNVPDPLSILGLGSGTTLTQTRAFLWQHGKMHDLGTLGGPDSWAMYVNDHGQVAGASYTSDVIADTKTGTPQIDAFLWEDGTMKDLGNLGGTNGSRGAPGIVNALNNRGQVVGVMTLPGDLINHPFLWDGEKLSDLGSFGGSFSTASGINDAGEVVGYSYFAGDLVKHAFLWKNGVMTDLGTVGTDPCSFAFNINTKGQIVGGSQNAECNPFTHAVLWENGEPGVDLNTLIPPGTGLQLTVADWINDRGEIVGLGHAPSCTNGDNCDAHAFVLIPCDENHPDVEGCDYDAVDTEPPAEPSSAQLNPAQITQTPPASPDNSAETVTRFRSSCYSVSFCWVSGLFWRRL